MSSASPLQICTNAATDINAIAAGEPLYPEQIAVALSHFNRMLGQWKTRRAFAYFIQEQLFTWPSTKTSYTIGPSGADFTITGDRPVMIEDAKLVLQNNCTPAPSEIPLGVINAREYARINIPGVETTLVSEIWYNPTYPNGTITPWPLPTDLSYQLKLYWWSQLNEVSQANIAAALNWPPGYEDAVTWSLSERLCIPFGKQVSPDLKDQAAAARTFIKSMNIKLSTIAPDVPSSMPHKGISLSGFLARNF